MSIINLRKALNDKVRGKLSLTDITLSYKEGGKYQVICITVIKNSLPNLEEFEISGDANPIVEADIIGQRLIEKYAEN